MTRVRVNAGDSCQITESLLDDAGEAVDPADVSAVTLTLLNLESYTPESPTAGIVNNRQAADVLVSPTDLVLTSGTLTYTLTALDNVVLNPRRQVERHRAVFRVTFTGGTRTLEIEVDVVNVQGAV